MKHAEPLGHLWEGVSEGLREASIGLTVDVVTVTGLSVVGAMNAALVLQSPWPTAVPRA